MTQVAPARPPDLSDVYRAWNVTISPDDPRTAVSVGAYLVHAPGCHPWWQFWSVAAIALRDFDGQTAPAHRAFPEATHEFLIVTLDPRHPLPEVGNWHGAAWLSPPDVATQAQLPSDTSARRVLDSMAAAIAAGRSPDSDYRGWWNRAIAATAAHERAGLHDEPFGRFEEATI